MIAGSDVTAALGELGVDPGDTLYVHSGMQGAVRMEGDTREEKMDAVIAGLEGAVPDGRLIMPTYTYSFCRDETYDVRESPSTVGLLTERFRRREGVRRTLDPIFSSALTGALPAAWEERLFTARDVTCFGEESLFAHLYEIDAKLVFFGVSFEFCTFLYLVEQRLEVPYRFMKEFRGDVVDGAAVTPVSAHYYVRRLDEDVENTFMPLAAELLERGLARELRIPRGPALLVAGARATHDVAAERIASDPDYLLTRGRAGVR
jgi:aminoglycoside 3-N-acetyltransferase